MKFSAGVLDATPGTVTKAQVPAEKVQLKEDHEKPVIEDKTGSKKIPSSEPVIIEAKITDNERVTSAAIFFIEQMKQRILKKSKCRRTERTSLPFKNLCT